MTNATTDPLREASQNMHAVTQRAFDEGALRQLYEMSERSELANSGCCFSLYLPMSAANAEQNWLQLKNGITAIERALDDDSRTSCASMLSELHAMLPKERLLRTFDGTLAIFVCDAGSDVFFFEQTHAFRTTVAEYFDLVPFAQLSRGTAPLYLIALTHQSVRLYRVHGQRFERLEHDDIPERLEDALGYELTESALKGHMGERASGTHRGMIFHGHGAGSEKEKKQETRQYFSIIDDAVCELVGSEHPVVLMGTQEVLAIFREQTCLSERQIVLQNEGSPAHLDESALREQLFEAREVLRSQWAQDEADELNERIERHELVTNPTKLARAAKEGRVLALYVGERMAASKRSAGKHARKFFDLSNKSIAMLVQQVLKLGGRVRALPPGFRTPHGARVAAVLRY